MTDAQIANAQGEYEFLTLEQFLKLQARIAELEAGSGEAAGYISDMCAQWLEQSHCSDAYIVPTITKGRNHLQNNPIYLRPQPAIPEGWKLVPIDPLDCMVDTMVMALSERGITDVDCIDTACAYRAMLAAAPSPEGECSKRDTGATKTHWESVYFETVDASLAEACFVKGNLAATLTNLVRQK